MKLTYGDGLLQTQRAKLANGNKCICITKRDTPKTIGYVSKEYDKVVDESEIDVILEFKNIQSARVLQDELNELISIWSREIGQTLP